MKLDIVIHAAGAGRRMRSYGPKCLLPVTGEPLLLRQLRLAGAAYPRVRFIVVAGFGADLVRAAVPKGVAVVENLKYETTGPAASVAVGLAAARDGAAVMVFPGDIVFGPDFLPRLKGESAVLITQSVRNDKVGVSSTDGVAVHLSYGLRDQWGQTFVLSPDARSGFSKAMTDPRRACTATHEVINHLMDSTFPFRAIRVGPMAEVDTARDALLLAG